ncbi:MAG: DUF1565 domain-containing protein [Kiritimatiellaeota bacterium]|nr:DUF1565 domain-containing protein [Kiritimatiellota bacterium]
MNELRRVCVGTGCLLLLSITNQVFAQANVENVLHVCAGTGNNRNDGSKEKPLKNVQKAIDLAKDGATILVAEGNYFGTLDSGNINVTKPVKIIGGYSPDFAIRDVLKHRTMIQPTPESNGTQKGEGTMQIQVKTPDTEVVIDGLIFDRGNSISYNAAGEGKPEGVASPMMNAIGTAGKGGPDLATERMITKQTALVYLENPRCDITIRNCAFINAPNYGIRGMFGGRKALIANNIFINNLMAACEISGGGIAKEEKEVRFDHNTVLFVWSRLRDMADMGYGYRYMNGIQTHHVTRNIIGCCIFSGLDRCRVESDKALEAKRVTTAEHNLFFLNRQGDLAIPGGGLFLQVKAEDFEDVDQLAKVEGNKTLTDPSAFKGVINEAYLNGFLTASYKETTNVDPNSPANTFRQAMGMNLTGTMKSSATMFANRYPWEEALNFFGAMEGYGAQKIQN